MDSAPKRKKRIPKLSYTNNRNLGWHVSYRDPKTNTPKKHRFGNVTRAEAATLYEKWLADYLSGKTPAPKRKTTTQDPTAPANLASAKVVPGCLLLVASSLIRFDEERTRKDGEPRRRGSITKGHFDLRKHGIKLFLQFLSDRYGPKATGHMLLADLTMHDVEAFNRLLTSNGASAKHVSKRMAVVKDIIERAGRPEHNSQVLTWNWDSRDVIQGQPTKQRRFPTLTQLKSILRASEPREQALVWMGIGLGFGQGDIAATRVGQIDEKSYDLRRGKTGIERYGDTPPMVWNAITQYLKETPRPQGELLFITKRGRPLVHGSTDAVRLWWRRLRIDLKETKKTLSSFYVLRHLGATEFGSRDGCSLGDMRRWLGHTSSSTIADVYMRPVPPEHRALIEWIRTCLISGEVNLSKKE